MFFVCDPKFLHKHCLQFLLGVKIAPRETETTFMQNFGETEKEHYGMLWYFLEWSIGLFGIFTVQTMVKHHFLSSLYYTKKPDKKKFIFQP